METYKYGLLVTSPISKTKNIGDYIQSLAAKQFINGEFTYVEKEDVANFTSSIPVKTIMNAWYMWHPENWPPSNDIIPLLTSMHISPLTANKILSPEGINYFIQNGPVGCRDTGTQKLLEENGIPCFFSGCLTLTLGETYKYEGIRNGIIFADPFIPPLKYIVNRKKTKIYPLNLLKSWYYFIKSPSIILKLIKSHPFFKRRFAFQTLYSASMFYHCYHKKFSKDVLLSAEYLSHIISVSDNEDNDSLINKAEDLVKKYSKASLVVTSRIHCALPCVGMGTPVIFITSKEMNSKNNMFNAPNRFGGLIDLFRTMTLEKGGLRSDDEELENIKIITLNTSLKPKDNWRDLKNRLCHQCHSFYS